MSMVTSLSTRVSRSWIGVRLGLIRRVIGQRRITCTSLSRSIQLPRCVTAVAMSVLLLIPGVVSGQDEATPVVIGWQHTLFSDVLQEERPLLIGLTEGYADTEDAYPVLYVLDGHERRFHEVTGTARTLASFQRMPPVIVVAIPSTHRTRDLTPSTSDRSAGVPSDAGGADRFLQFLRDELIHYVNATFRTTGHRTLIGASFGGLFAVHALHNHPEAFDAYLAISPSLWWNDEAAVAEFDRFLQRPDLPSKHLVLTLASEGSKMRTPIQKLTALLRRAAPPEFGWEFLEFPTETHNTVALQATYAGLLEIFADWRVSDDVVSAGIGGIEQLYANRGAKYGVSSEAPPGAFFGLGSQLLERGDPEGAIQAFRRAANQDPQYPLAYFGLGQAYEQLDRLEEAVRNLRTAVELAESVQHPAVQYLHQELARLEARVRRNP